MIDHLQGGRSLGEELAGSFYSSISRAELYSGTGAVESVIDRLLDQFEEVPVTRSIAEEASRIRRTSNVRLPDALIAATSLAVKRPLYTRNVRDFRRIARLRLHRPR